MTLSAGLANKTENSINSYPIPAAGTPLNPKMNQPDCARCGGTEGELSYDAKKANKGIRIHLTAYEGHKDTYYCSIKCLNVIKDNIKKRLQCYTPQGVYPASLTPSTVSVCQDRKT